MRTHTNAKMINGAVAPCAPHADSSSSWVLVQFSGTSDLARRPERPIQKPAESTPVHWRTHHSSHFCLSFNGHLRTREAPVTKKKKKSCWLSGATVLWNTVFQWFLSFFGLMHQISTLMFLNPCEAIDFSLFFRKQVLETSLSCSS